MNTHKRASQIQTRARVYGNPTNYRTQVTVVLRLWPTNNYGGPDACNANSTGGVYGAPPLFIFPRLFPHLSLELYLVYPYYRTQTLPRKNAR